MANQQSYESIGRLFGRERLVRMAAFLDAGGIVISPEAFAGVYVVLAILGSLLVTLAMTTLAPLRPSLFKLGLWLFKPLTVASPQFVLILALVISSVLVFILSALIIYVAVLLSADARRAKVEETLPDFLVLAAANVRAGMTIDQALWYAAKPEFGLLSDEVQVVAKRSFGGVPFNQAIDHLAVRFSSRSVRRTVSLIKQGLASGGQIAEILERTAEDVRNMQIIKKEIAASLLMYVIFIVFAAAIGTPFLFSVSSKLIALLENVFAQIPDTASTATMGSSSFIRPQPPIVSSYQFFIFVLLSTLVTAICSSMMIGCIQKGSKREGIKYLPFMLACGLIIFFIVSAVLDQFVHGIGGG